MFNIIEKSIQWFGRELVLQTGKIARQADGAVVATYGETSVLATVVYSKEPKADLDFFPLTVHYLEKFYAVGKIPGGFFKREGKPSEKEILTSRLIDRPIRPLFDESFRNEVQIIVSVLGYDDINTVDYLSTIAASAALAISGAPVTDIVAASKIGLVKGEFVINPSLQQLKDSSLDLQVAGTKDGVLMVESEAKELSEEKILEAVKCAHQACFEVIDLIQDFKTAVGKPEYEFSKIETEEQVDFSKKLEALVSDDLKQAFTLIDKVSRKQKISDISEHAKKSLLQTGCSEEFLSLNFNKYFKNIEKSIVRNKVLNENSRIDGRTLTDIRKIETEVDLFPRAHGTALFTRGETQALVFVTLGTDSDEQILDDIEGESRSRFMLHYNFPSFSVGETGRVGAPGRREIGHGKLAWRAINPVLPNREDFPYTIRVVSEITESNGSSSMATVCGSSMGLMAAGVKLKDPVAGIAMGLIKEGQKYAVLSDILGDEDHLGDMDFKVAGTEHGVTALQMDIKITSITYDIMSEALKQAKQGRLHILGKMVNAISSSRESVNQYVPKICTIQVSKDKIKDIIGSGGKIIKELCEVFEVKIDISNEGLVKVYGSNHELIEKALQKIEGLVAVPEIGKTYQGKVMKVIESGAFINIMPGKDGFLHISEITEKRGDDINQFIKKDEELVVKLVSIDDKGRLKLSYKNI